LSSTNWYTSDSKRRVTLGYLPSSVKYGSIPSTQKFIKNQTIFFFEINLGSLLNLAKHPSSTVQILGAEKALFRAMKTKHDTPKYGLIYHASLVGQTSAKLKGKVSRMLAAKAALAIRVDALGEDTNATLGLKQRADLEQKFALLEQNAV
jgi:hypothetical protein